MRAYIFSFFLALKDNHKRSSGKEKKCSGNRVLNVLKIRKSVDWINQIVRINFNKEENIKFYQVVFCLSVTNFYRHCTHRHQVARWCNAWQQHWQLSSWMVQKLHDARLCCMLMHVPDQNNVEADGILLETVS